MNKSGCYVVKCASWNIAGKFGLFKLPEIQEFIERYDILCLTETHSIETGTVQFSNFKCYEYPDTSCNYQYPRGGTCILIKKENRKIIKNVNYVMTDVIEIVLANNTRLINLYIPPLDSPYYNEQYVEILCSWFHEAEQNNTAIIAMGDLNARFGELNMSNRNYEYNRNEDNTMNQNGKHIKELLFNTSSALPLNHLKVDGRIFDGGYTFNRNGKMSQIDWCMVNKHSLPMIENFNIVRNCPDISDHKLIQTTVQVKGENSLDSLVRGAIDMNILVMNQSKIPLINKNNTNLQILDNLLKVDIQTTDFTTMSSHDIANFLTTKIRKVGKMARIPINNRYNAEVSSSRAQNLDMVMEQKELSKWKFVKETNDMKGLWDAINMKGELNQPTDRHLDVDDLADMCNKKFKIDSSQVYYKDLKTNITNEELDKEIDEEEVKKAAEKLHESKTSDGIASSTVRHLLSTLMPVLLLLYNIVFIGGAEAYPSNWINFINGIAKKGRLDPPRFVRFISIMGIFEKIYQNVITERLCSFFKIPFLQTAYQKGKSCCLHVMTIRLMKLLAKKTKQKLYIVFTDFEAAFDLVSRRLLFKKLIKLGVSSIMLGALISIYAASKSVVEDSGQYSDYLLLLSGVKQGAPPSGLLYIAYTVGLIDVFNITFHPEPLIYIFHFLMHADDILMLSTSRNIAISKVKCLIQYCKENFIRLQLKKCAGMCVNGDSEEDMEPMSIEDLVLNLTTCEVYLGSAITNSVKLIDDVNADIKMRQVNVIKFFAFLRNNRNAPVSVKGKVLDACILSSLLYNSETWSNVCINKLEVMHRRMLRSILGVSTKTCNEILYIELGVVSMRTRVTIKQFEFWKKVLEMTDDNPLKYIIKKAKEAKLKEILYYEKIFSKYNSKDDILSEFYQRIRDTIHKKASRGSSKYITYLSINPELSVPSCYDNAKYTDVNMLAKLRTSSHNLHVETGRRNGVPREQRLCHCETDVETECHFLSICESYSDLRMKHGVNGMSMVDIMDNQRCFKYIEELMERRKYLREWVN